MKERLSLRQAPKSEALEGYKLSRKYLLRPDKASGAAGIKEAWDPDGNPVLIKTWAKPQDEIEEATREIWRNEIRQLHRLGGYPGAEDYIVKLKASGIDEGNYYLILNPGLRRPLAAILKEDKPADTLSPYQKHLVWENLKRLAHGLNILHNQGLLHRNLSTWSVLTTGGGTPDFQLTGFEWSIRLTSNLGVKSSPLSKKHQTDSFLRDWQQFGEVAAELLKAPVRRLKDLKIANHEVSAHLNADESKLLRDLLQIHRNSEIDGSKVIERIVGITSKLERATAKYSPRLHLAVATSPLSQVIRKASKQEVEIDDVEEQLTFIRSDLSVSPKLISIKPLKSFEQPTYALVGRHLTYYLDDFTSRDDTKSNWEFAFCGKATQSNVQTEEVIDLSPQDIDVHTVREGTTLLPKMRGKVKPWRDLFTSLKDIDREDSRLTTVRKAFTLSQLVEYLFAISNAYPVEIIKIEPGHSTSSSSETVLYLRSRNDSIREALGKSLGLNETTARRLQKVLQSESDMDLSETRWVLTEGGLLGDQTSRDTEWQFIEESQFTDGSLAYKFSGPAMPDELGNAFIVPSDFVGRDSQFKRRLKALQSLSEHVELSSMLADPRGNISKSEDTLIEDEAFRALDSSKQEALKLILEIIPLFLVQGPPGVGKTHLVTELVRRIFEEDNASRILLSAQSNFAVDHLLRKISESLSESIPGPTLLAVRCRSKDSRFDASEFDLGHQSAKVARSLINSEIYKNSSPARKAKVEALCAVYSDAKQQDLQREWGSKENVRRAFEGLVLRAANLVFATTNSSELERLCEDKSQFDWAIVEEAGKATGSELISPLLLSHRRLMIGDHKQLPPFDSTKARNFLSQPSRVKEALSIGSPLIGKKLRDNSIEELLTELDSDESSPSDLIQDLCAEATRNIFLFETVIEDELTRQKTKKTGRKIAYQLKAQHRMHPAIAELVSHCFYDDGLKTDPEKEKLFRSEPPVIRSKNPSILPDLPIIWIDMPWVQATAGKKIGEQRPRYSNTEEIEAVKLVLSLLEARSADPSKPSLAVLSPYAQQVKRLSDLLKNTLDRNLTGAISQFNSASKGLSVCNTVDSFQGNEADAVVVSLVRNNNQSTLSRSLGFLSDARRMNVLLSRARRKLIIIGSLSFLKTVLSAPRSPEERKDIRFLELLLKRLDIFVETNEAAIVKFDDLQGK